MISFSELELTQVDIMDDITLGDNVTLDDIEDLDYNN